MADFQKGKEAYEKRDYKTALRELEPLAQEGNADAQFYVGEMLYQGKGSAPDYKKALSLLELLA